jgi:trk system potassium uptake protein TrkH
MVSLVLKIIVITFVIEGLGGIGFIVNLEVLEYPKTKRLSLHTRLVLTVTALLIVVGTLSFFCWNGRIRPHSGPCHPKESFWPPIFRR